MDRNSEYFVFKVNLGTTSSSVNIGDSNLRSNHAYALVSDGDTGYYATGFIHGPSTPKTGL
jgi:hypothetical protein